MNDVPEINRPDGLPEGWTPWFGRLNQPQDYVNGPVFTRDGRVIMPGYRLSPAQWTWECYEEPFGTLPDDIIGYMPGHVKVYNVAGGVPDDWVEGNDVLWLDNTIWSQGLRRGAIAWQDQYGSGKASIVAYTASV